MCGVGNRTCGICRYAGGCLVSMLEDGFFPATKEQVLERLQKNQYPSDTEIMKKYVGISDDALRFAKDLYREGL